MGARLLARSRVVKVVEEADMIADRETRLERLWHATARRSESDEGEEWHGEVQNPRLDFGWKNEQQEDGQATCRKERDKA